MYRSDWSVLLSVSRYLSQSFGSEWEVRVDPGQGNIVPPYIRVESVAPSSYSGSSRIVQNTMPLRVVAFAGDASTVEKGQQQAYAIRERMFATFQRGLGTLAAPTGLVAVAGSGTLGAGNYTYRVTALCGGQTTPTAATAITLGANASVSLTWDPLPGATRFGVWRGSGGGAEQLIGYASGPAYVDQGGTSPSTTAILPVTNTTFSGRPMRIPLFDYTGLTMEEPATDAADRISPAEYVRTDGLTVNVLRDPLADTAFSVIAAFNAIWLRVGLDPSSAGRIATSATVDRNVS